MQSRSKSFSIFKEKIQIPFVIEATRSETIFKKIVSDFDGITVAVLNLPPKLIEAITVPIFSFLSEIEI